MNRNRRRFLKSAIGALALPILGPKLADACESCCDGVILSAPVDPPYRVVVYNGFQTDAERRLIEQLLNQDMDCEVPQEGLVYDSLRHPDLPSESGHPVPATS